MCKEGNVCKQLLGQRPLTSLGAESAFRAFAPAMLNINVIAIRGVTHRCTQKRYVWDGQLVHSGMTLPCSGQPEGDCTNSQAPKVPNNTVGQPHLARAPTLTAPSPPVIAAHPERPGAAGKGCPCPAKAPAGAGLSAPWGTARLLALATPLLGPRALVVQPQASRVWGPRPDNCGKGAAAAAAAAATTTTTSSITRLDSTGVTRCPLPTTQHITPVIWMPRFDLAHQKY